MPARKRLLIAVLGSVVAAASLPTAAAHGAITCQRFAAFAPGAFTDPARIDNGFLPLAPGSQLVMEGRANRGGGPTPHRVVFTVTDLTKVIGGVRSRVVWDLDVNQGVVVESELAFWAQDDAGNVWNTGEYPEEFQAGAFLAAPSVWLAGLDGAEPGVHMAASPAASNTFFLQGVAPAVGFHDCAKVLRLGDHTCVPVGCFDGVVRTQETSPLDPGGGSQLKFYAPGIGVVRIEARNDPEGETLVLTERSTLGADALAAVRAEALRLDAHAYTVNGLYQQTAPAEGPQPPAPPPPPESPAPEPQVQVAPRRSASARLTTTAARATVRRALHARMPRWRVTAASCRLRGERRATCTFTARRRGSTLKGSGAVTLRAAGGRAGYRLVVQIRRGGCRPARGRHCSRRAVWAR